MSFLSEVALARATVNHITFSDYDTFLPIHRDYRIHSNDSVKAAATVKNDQILERV